MNPETIMIGNYDYRLVALSILIAMLGSYATIDLAARVKATRGGARLSWRIGGATAMAIGTWAMHYTGMLAFHLPVPISYDWPTSLLSFLPSLLASAVALIVVIRPKMRSARAFVASILVGGGIAALHYIAMASMRFQGMDFYSAALVTLSVLLAMLFALLSIWLTFLFRDAPSGWKLRKVGSVALMGTAIWAMHYTGMASASFMKTGTVPDLSRAVQVSFLGAAGIGAVALMVLTVAILGSTVDRLQKQRALLDSLFEQAPQAVVLMDQDNRIVRVNKDFTRLFGYSPEEASGRRIADLIVPEESRAEVGQYFQLVAQGQRREGEGVRRRKDGSSVAVDVVHVPVSLPSGEKVIYAIYRDISERKLAEEKLRATTEHLRALSASLQSAREEEGTRIARELHDELGSTLTSLRWNLDEIDELLSTKTEIDPNTLRGKIAAMIALVEDTMDTVRRISSELRPSILEEVGLVATIEWEAHRFEARTGITCHFQSSVTDVHLTPQQSTAALRIFQEALTNILRHAGATKVEIAIKEEGGEFVLTIRDNGRGVTPSEAAGTGALGLLGMRERAHLIGAEVSINGFEDRGTVVTLRVPIAG